MNTFEKAKNFIYRNARPLDLARWQFHFEGGSKEAVLKALSVYQNEDGGFGNALEADCFNPNSSPIQTWAATQILKEIGVEDKSLPIIKGILRYLGSGKDFNTQQEQWLNTVPANNEYPHAVWWEYGENGSEFKYNPTAALAGFAIKFVDKDSALFETACRIAKRAAEWYLTEAPDEEHITGCFIRLYEYCMDAGAELFDADALLQKLKEKVNKVICRDTEKWYGEYVPTPSCYILSKTSPFYQDNADMVAEECRIIKERQLPDGSFTVTWKWWTDYTEYEIAANWWKSDFVIRNMRFLKAFE